jgi:hypothetical protein
MAIHKISSKNSAWKHTPKMRRTTPSQQALAVRQLEKNLINNGHMPFAREAEVLCLVARFLRTKGYRAEADAFSDKAKDAAIMARACEY